MKIAYFDTVAGIAGDMTIAACVSAGMPLGTLTGELKKLPLGGFEITGRHLSRNGIDAVHIDVVVTEQPRFHRDLASILGIIDASRLPEPVKVKARAMFTVIAEAEAKVHGTTIDRVHFHEVGALDSIVDIVGAAVCLQYFGVERVYSSPVKLGSAATITTQHGIMPVPAPAVLEILRDYPVVFTSIPEELTTPTGAAIIKSLSTGVLDAESLRVRSVGYGAGTREISGVPNLLRLVIGDLDITAGLEELVIVETNIDDMNPQIYPYLIEQLLAAGAHDAYAVPITMKKGRPGVLVSAMTGRGRLDAVAGVLLRETTTIGLRVSTAGRLKLERREVVVDTSFGPVRAKAVIRNGREVVAPEFEECKRIAQQQGLAVLEVQKRLENELTRPGSS